MILEDSRSSLLRLNQSLTTKESFLTNELKILKEGQLKLSDDIKEFMTLKD